MPCGYYGRNDMLIGERNDIRFANSIMTCYHVMLLLANLM